MGGFAYDDTNVLMLISKPSLERGTFNDWVETQHITPTILKPWGAISSCLRAVQKEGSEVLSGCPF